jgi:hypothetical protein
METGQCVTPTNFAGRLAEVEKSQAQLQRTLDVLAIRISDLNDLLSAWTEAQQMLKAFNWLAKFARFTVHTAAIIAALWLFARTGNWHLEK